MPTMTNYEFGDFVLVPFPFTDQSASKKRPAVIISSKAYHSERPDLILMAVTSQIKAPAMTGEVMIKDWQGAGLIKPSVIKPIITTIEYALVLRQLGQLKEEEQSALRQAIEKILG
jgi:mRNA interferase MazF